MGKGAVAIKEEPQSENEEEKDSQLVVLRGEKRTNFIIRSGFTLSSNIINAAMKRSKMMSSRLQGSKVSNNLVGVMAIKMKFLKDEH